MVPEEGIESTAEASSAPSFFAPSSAHYIESMCPAKERTNRRSSVRCGGALPARGLGEGHGRRWQVQAGGWQLAGGRRAGHQASRQQRARAEHLIRPHTQGLWACGRLQRYRSTGSPRARVQIHARGSADGV